MPKVSIIVAVYNVAPYLRRSMDCLMNQTERDLEFICVDDCSTDESLSILREYEAKDSRFKIIASEVNGGAAVARNKGLETATGEYLGFIDPDDAIDLNYYEELYKKAQETNADIVKCQRTTIDKQATKVSTLNKYIAKSGLYFFTYEWTTAIYKSSIIFNNHIRFPDEVRKGQDTVFLFRIVLKSNTIELIDTVNYYYYKREDSLNANELPLKSVLSALQAMSMVCEEINQSDLYDKNPEKYLMAYEAKLKSITNTFLFRNKSFNSRFLGAEYLINNYHKCKDRVGLKNIFKPKWIVQYLENNLRFILALLFMLYRTKDELLNNTPAEMLFSIKNKKVKNQKYKVITILCAKFEQEQGDDTLIEKMLSVKNKIINKRKYKVINIFGIKIKFRKKEYEIEQKLKSLSKQLTKQEKEIKEQKEEYAIQIEEQKCEISGLQQQIVKQKEEYIEQIEAQKEELSKQKEEYTIQIEEQKGEIAGLQQQIVKQKEEYAIEIEEQKGEIAGLQKQIVKHKEKTERQKNELIEKLQRKAKELNKKIIYTTFKYCPVEKREECLKDWYALSTWESLNLENPKTFNDKINWMKLYDSTPIKTKLADKYLVREYVREKIGEKYLIPLLGVWDNFDDIDFDKLPAQFVLKCNHGCGCNLIVKDKSSFNKEKAKKDINHWLNTDYAFFGLEMHYSPIPRKIIAEEFIQNAENELYDYKVWCFGGKAKYIQFLSERNTDGLKMAFYDRDWNKQNFVYREPDTKTIQKPEKLNLMLELAEKLSQGFSHVRVDFYITNEGKILFGELTFTSANGIARWVPKEANLMLGELIDLNIKDKLLL